MFKTKIYKFLLLIVVLSFTGATISQFFWIKKTYQKENELTRAMVDNCVAEAFNVFYSNTLDMLDSIHSNCVSDSVIKEKFPRLESFTQLDSIILLTFKKSGINADYNLKILTKQGQVVYTRKIFVPEKERFYSFQYEFYKFENGFKLDLEFPAFSRSSKAQQNFTFWYMLAIFSILLILLVYLLFYKLFKRLSAQFEMRTNAINNLMHEFKTPLASLKLASEMLQNPAMNSQPDKVALYGEMMGNEIGRIQRQGEYLQNIVLIEENQVQLNEEPVNAINEIKRIISHYLLVRPEIQNHISLKFNANNPDILFDRNHFESIILNLTENALKYGGVKVFVEISVSNDNDHLKIAVSDNGPGIPKKFHHLVFQRFFRVPTGNRHNIKGFGIGLYYVKMIVELASGSITLHNLKTGGTRFEILLPSLKK